ncbi:MAG: peptide deformylase [Neisseriaceae bacterium]|jgi:peptide deformylase
MIRDVVQITDPLIFEKSKEIIPEEFNSSELQNLINDMVDTMRATNGVGISAIQIGVKKRIAVIEYGSDNPRYKDIGRCPLTIVINPEIKPGDNLSALDEGCLSVIGKRDSVIRPKSIEYKYYDQMGRMIIDKDDGFFARVMQHEVDHMDGILFPMRVKERLERDN